MLNMMDKKFFSGMRKSGFNLGVSKSKITQMMFEILLQIPEGTQNLKDVIIQNLGYIGLSLKSREINDAWNSVKKRAAKEYPDKFILGERDVLLWNDGQNKIIEKKYH